MTKNELDEVLAIAANSAVSLADVDTEPLHGLYTRAFKGPVATTRLVAAKALREVAVTFNGTVDAEALAEFGKYARRRVLVVG
jgi:predicted GNAT superfamily acetyltransferase